MEALMREQSMNERKLLKTRLVFSVTEIPFRQGCVTRSKKVMWTVFRMGFRGMKLHLSVQLCYYSLMSVFHILTIIKM